MVFCKKYCTPSGFDDLKMESDGEALTLLRFLGSSDEKKSDAIKNDLPIFRETTHWLDVYFSGKQPDFLPAFRIENSTPFRKEVVEILLSIPFGKTMSYGEIAARIAKAHGRAKMSAQAVGGAVGWNPICIIIPCHRVIGKNGKLTGYGGGIKNKIALLKLENITVEETC